MNIILRILFIFVCFIFLQGAYNQNVTCQTFIPQNYIQTGSSNTVLTSNQIKDTEIAISNIKNEQTVSNSEKYGTLSNNVFNRNNNCICLKSKQYDLYNLTTRLKQNPAIRAP